MNIRIDFFTDEVKALEVKKVIKKYVEVQKSKTYSTTSNFYLRGYELENVTEETKNLLINELQGIYKVDLNEKEPNRIHLLWKFNANDEFRKQL